MFPLPDIKRTMQVSRGKWCTSVAWTVETSEDRTTAHHLAAFFSTSVVAASWLTDFILENLSSCLCCMLPRAALPNTATKTTQHPEKNGGSFGGNGSNYYHDLHLHRQNIYFSHCMAIYICICVSFLCGDIMLPKMALEMLSCCATRWPPSTTWIPTEASTADAR